MMPPRALWAALILLAAATPVLLGMAAAAAAPPTDAPSTGAPVERVATLGSVPVLNSFVMALGKADTIVNTLPPPWGNNPRYRFHRVFAPHLAGLPVIQDPNRAPDLETILTLRPQIVLTTYQSSVDALEKHGIPVMLLEWRRPEEVKACMTRVAGLLGVPEWAAAYTTYFDATVERVRARMAEKDRPTVLYLDPETLTQPHVIAEWWIEAGGGRSVTKDGRDAEVRSFSMEEAVAWDPDFLIVASASQKAKLLRHEVLGRMRAARDGRVLVVPTGAHTWGNRTAEQPLTVLWAAKHLHPASFTDLDFAGEVRRFYAEFFRAELSPEQVAGILGGG